MIDKTPSPARLEAFSDGVIAVIITIMVLEIKVPHLDDLQGLRLLAPALLIYLLSFAFTGVYWLNHQHLVGRVEKAGHSVQCANLLFLFCLSLLPFTTAYVIDKQLSGFVVSVYAASLLIVAISFMCLRLAVHGDLNRDDKLNDDDRKGLRNHIVSIAVYTGSIVLGRFYPRAVLTAIGLLTLVWALPNLSFNSLRRP